MSCAVAVFDPETWAHGGEGRLAACPGVRAVSFFAADRLGETVRSNPYGCIVVPLGCHVSADVIARLAYPCIVATPTTGEDHIDVAAVRHRGGQIVSLRGEREFLRTITGTAEHTLGLLLALARKIPAAASSTREGGWTRRGLAGGRLRGRTLLVVGHGRLGSMVARLAGAFGMRVCVVDDAPALPIPTEVEHLSLQDGLRRADVVSLHASWAEGQPPILDAERLACLKQGAWVVNTARGQLVDTDALLAALESGHLGGAALDVVADDARWTTRFQHAALQQFSRSHDNLIVTPHIGGFTSEDVAETRRFVCDKLVACLETQKEGAACLP